jgi:uncharacterized protein
MPEDVMSATVSRIAEHVRAHPELRRIHVVLHGGEPLLAGRHRLARIASGLRQALDGLCDLDLRMQTNGLRLDSDICEMLVRQEIRTGISVDGDRASHDRHRRRANGTGSYDAVVRAVQLIGSPPYRRIFAGLLCTVDVENDPSDVYQAMVALDPPRVDFLLPHATWDRPPSRPLDRPHAHARWLMTVYDLWTADGKPFDVRLFDAIKTEQEGRRSLTEALGLASPDLVVIETDGEIEQADWLKTAGQDAPQTGFHILRHSLDQAARHPGFLAQSADTTSLSRTCRECRVVRICGGGLYAHRYRSANGFDNPSVYCGDLIRLIDHCVPDARPRPTGNAHKLTSHAFDSLAAGAGDAGVLRDLVSAESSICRTLFAALCTRYRGPEADAVTQMDRRWPDVTTLVLRHPYLRTWSMRALEGRLTRQAVRQRLAGIAVAVALRTGTNLAVGLPATAQSVHVPGYGRLILPPRPGSSEMIVTDGALVLRLHDRSLPIPATCSRALPYWEPARSLAMGGCRVLLEDCDPDRDVFEATPAPRLSNEEYVRWQRLFAEAAVHVRDRPGHRAAGVPVLLSALTPISGCREQGLVAAGPDTFGALGLSLPTTADALAALLGDGIQQMKFNALSDLFDLAETSAAKDRLRAAYLGRAPLGALSDRDLTDYGRRLANVLRS